MPTIYLTSLGVVASLKRGHLEHRPKVGLGSVSGILRFPPDWSYRMLRGHIVGFMPKAAELKAARKGHVTFEQYRNQLLRRWSDLERYAPGASRRRRSRRPILMRASGMGRGGCPAGWWMMARPSAVCAPIR